MGIKVDSTFSVGIDLEAALKAPGSDADIILREGDVVVVPKYNNTVRINGAVMQPNVVSYKQGKDVKYYIGQAGGYNQVAKKNKKYIIYMTDCENQGEELHRLLGTEFPDGSDASGEISYEEVARKNMWTIYEICSVK